MYTILSFWEDSLLWVVVGNEDDELHSRFHAKSR